MREYRGGSARVNQVPDGPPARAAGLRSPQPSAAENIGSAANARKWRVGGDGPRRGMRRTCNDWHSSCSQGGGDAPAWTVAVPTTRWYLPSTMDARLDSSFESWGKFTETIGEEPGIPGRLSYDPLKGIRLELVEKPSCADPRTLFLMPCIPVLLGRLVDGTLVTLLECITTKTSFGAGGVGLPTALIVNRALFGSHIDNVESLKVESYTVELSSLSNWMCVSPATLDMANNDGKPSGVDIRFRRPDPIRVGLPHRTFDLRIPHGWKTSKGSGSVAVHWHAGVTIAADESILLGDAREAAWQAQNLIGLLVGRPVVERSVTFKLPEEIAVAQPTSSVQLLYHRRGKHDESDVHHAESLVPYDLIKEDFSEIAVKWFSRSEQAVLAANVFFGSQLLEAPAVNVKFLAAAQAAESYHRSLDTGVYMDQEDYNEAIDEFQSAIPESIQGDHRASLKFRLKYGNEHSLRKRLRDMFDRIPENARLRIASDVSQFVSKVVDTRNYYTHYDHESQVKAFDGKDVHTAAERLRFLIVANLLHDLGIKDEELLGVLERSREFQHWGSQELPL